MLVLSSLCPLNFPLIEYADLAAQEGHADAEDALCDRNRLATGYFAFKKVVEERYDKCHHFAFDAVL